jgi:hypothetical protein
MEGEAEALPADGADHAAGLLLLPGHPGLQRPAQVSAWRQPQRHHLHRPHRLSASNSGCSGIVASTARRPVGGASAPACDHRLGIWGLIGSGVCGSRMTCPLLRRSLRLGPGRIRNGDHVSGKRCSGLDLPGCDPGSGYAARGINTWGTELAYRSLLIRDDVRAAPPSSLEPITRTSTVRTGSGDPWPDSLGRQGPGWLPGLPSSSRYTPFQLVVSRCSACSRTCRNPVSTILPRRSTPSLKAAEPVVPCIGRMDLRTAAAARQHTGCWAHPCAPIR